MSSFLDFPQSFTIRSSYLSLISSLPSLERSSEIFSWYLPEVLLTLLAWWDPSFLTLWSQGPFRYRQVSALFRFHLETSTSGYCRNFLVRPSSCYRRMSSGISYPLNLFSSLEYILPLFFLVLLIFQVKLEVI